MTLIRLSAATAAVIALAACAAPNLQSKPQLVTLVGGLDRSFVAADKPGELVARLRIEASELADAERPDINMVLVVDTSGSMAGDSIRFAKQAAAEMVGNLTENDHLAVVTFGSTTEVLVSSKKLERSQLPQIREQIDAMMASGTTDLAGGLRAAMAEAKRSASQDRVSAIVLLSDGVPNSADGIVALADTARAQGTPIAAFGLGLDYDETLLASVAQRSGGWFHYIEAPAMVAEVLRNEVLRLEQVLVRNAVLTLTPGPSTQLEVVGLQTMRAGPRTVAVTLGDLTEAQLRDVLIRVKTAEHRVGSTLELMDAVLTYDDARSSSTGIQQRAFLAARATDDEVQLSEGRNDDIAKQAARAEAAAATLSAVGLARDGKLQVANNILERAEAAAEKAATTYMDDAFSKDAAAMRELHKQNLGGKKKTAAEDEVRLRAHRSAMGVLQQR